MPSFISPIRCGRYFDDAAIDAAISSFKTRERRFGAPLSSCRPSSSGLTDVETKNHHCFNLAAADAGYAFLRIRRLVGAVCRPDCLVGAVGIRPYVRLHKCATTVIWPLPRFSAWWPMPAAGSCRPLPGWRCWCFGWWAAFVVGEKMAALPDWKGYSIGWLLMVPFWFALVGLRPSAGRSHFVAGDYGLGGGLPIFLPISAAGHSANTARARHQPR